MDLPNSKNVNEIAEVLNVQSIRNVTWHIQATNAVTGECLDEVLDKLSTMLTK